MQVGHPNLQVRVGRAGTNKTLPAGLTTLSELRYLDRSDNSLYKLRGIEKLKNLRVLDLSGNDLAIGEARRISAALPDCVVTV